ncbi:hypothetical protein T261_7175 [Streptomyces lydicus]|nr:hypothetical protein T261_7175 [Streptomyces lydicus]
MLRHTRLAGESAEYLAAREELRLAEIDLMHHREKVAAQRRALPQGPPVDDYVFLEGPADLDTGDTPVREVTLSGLFTAPDRPLIIYHLMYGKRQTEPCPMCTLWIDGFNGIARDGEGTVRHFYSAHPRMADDIDQRGIDLLAPVWHLLDLTPQGRGDWYPNLDY